MKNFGEFYNNQIETAGTIILSRTQKVSPEKLQAAVALLREKNADAAIITTPWDELDGKTILAAMEKVSLADELMERIRAEHEAEEAEHHHHHDHDDDDHDEHEHHYHDHEHEHDDHDEDEHEHHHHHHDEDEKGHEHHHHHHHHHADEVFGSWGMETPTAYSKAEIQHILDQLEKEEEYGIVLRAKGMVPGLEGGWVYFDYVPGESNVREGKPDVTGKFCVIGSKLKEENLKKLFAK